MSFTWEGKSPLNCQIKPNILKKKKKKKEKKERNKTNMLRVVFLICLFFMLQGHDGVDLEMNLNDDKSRLDNDEFGDVVCCFYL